MFGSLKKGHNFERDVAEWLTAVTGKNFYRVPMSGAAGTVNDLDNLRGDIMTEAFEYVDLVLECKSYKAPVKLADINNEKSLLNKWISQTKNEAGGRFWILFFKSNRGPTFLLMPTLDPLEYASDASLHVIFKECSEVCRMKDYLILQVRDQTQTRQTKANSPQVKASSP